MAIEQLGRSLLKKQQRDKDKAARGELLGKAIGYGFNQAQRKIDEKTATLLNTEPMRILEIEYDDALINAQSLIQDRRKGLTEGTVRTYLDNKLFNQFKDFADSQGLTETHAAEDWARQQTASILPDYLNTYEAAYAHALTLSDKSKREEFIALHDGMPDNPGSALWQMVTEAEDVSPEELAEILENSDFTRDARAMNLFRKLLSEGLSLDTSWQLADSGLRQRDDKISYKPYNETIPEDNLGARSWEITENSFGEITERVVFGTIVDDPESGIGFIGNKKSQEIWDSKTRPVTTREEYTYRGIKGTLETTQMVDQQGHPEGKPATTTFIPEGVGLGTPLALSKYEQAATDPDLNMGENLLRKHLRESFRLNGAELSEAELDTFIRNSFSTNWSQSTDAQINSRFEYMSRRIAGMSAMLEVEHGWDGDEAWAMSAKMHAEELMSGGIRKPLISGAIPWCQADSGTKPSGSKYEYGNAAINLSNGVTFADALNAYASAEASSEGGFTPALDVEALFRLAEGSIPHNEAREMTDGELKARIEEIEARGETYIPSYIQMRSAPTGNEEKALEAMIDYRMDAETGNPKYREAVIDFFKLFAKAKGNTGQQQDYINAFLGKLPIPEEAEAGTAVTPDPDFRMAGVEPSVVEPQVKPKTPADLARSPETRSDMVANLREMQSIINAGVFSGQARTPEIQEMSKEISREINRLGLETIKEVPEKVRQGWLIMKEFFKNRPEPETPDHYKEMLESWNQYKEESEATDATPSYSGGNISDRRLEELTFPSDTPATLVIKRYEDFRAKPYWDVNHWTWGFGTNANIEGGKDAVIPRTKRISLEDAQEEFLAHIQTEITDKLESFQEKHDYDWNDNQKAALTSFMYNLGSGSLNQVTSEGTRSNREIAQAMLLYYNSGGKRIKGLVERREDEVELFRGEVSII